MSVKVYSNIPLALDLIMRKSYLTILLLVVVAGNIFAATYNRTGKPIDIPNNQYLRLMLAKDSINTDDILIRFNSDASSKYVINEDAPYRKGSGKVSLCSISSDNVDLAINNLPLPKNGEPIGLNVNTSTDGAYQLELTQLVGVPKLYDIWLMDAYKKDSVNMRINPVYSFNVLKSDTTSFGARRFALFIHQNQAYAYHLLNFTANKMITSPQVQVAWKTENEGNSTHFTVERSTDGGKIFNVLGTQDANDQGIYSLTDKTPVKGQNEYRLKQEDLNGTISYSRIVTVMYSDNGSAIAGKVNIYPNPASSVINLAMPDNAGNSYNIRIMNSSGVVIKQIAAAQNQWQGDVSNLLIGTYVIEVVNNRDKSFIGQAKFVKF